MPHDRYHTKANQELVEEEEKDKSFISTQLEILKCCTRKTVYEKVFFFQSSYIVKEIRSIHFTNLHSLCEQVARSSTPSAKQKLSQLKLFFQKGKAISPQFQKNGIRRMWFLICLKLGIYIM